MATLAFNLDGQSYVSDVFEGGKVVQLSFPAEGTQVLFVETRLGATLPWKTIGSRIIERDLVVNIPAAGEGQEFRFACIAEPAAAEIVPIKETSGSGGGQPGPNTVGSEEIKDGSVQEEDLSPEVIDKMTHTYDPDGEGIHLGGNVGTGMQYGNTELNDDPASLLD